LKPFSNRNKASLFSSSHSQKKPFSSYILRKRKDCLFLLLAVEVGRRSPEVGDFYVPLLVKQDVFGLGFGFMVYGLWFRVYGFRV
jgi:hypothetical protein